MIDEDSMDLPVNKDELFERRRKREAGKRAMTFAALASMAGGLENILNPYPGMMQESRDNSGLTREEREQRYKDMKTKEKKGLPACKPQSEKAREKAKKRKSRRGW